MFFFDLSVKIKNHFTGYGDMILSVEAISDLTWGKYALSKNFSSIRMSEEFKKEIIENSYNCGREQALFLQKRFGRVSLREYFDRFSLKLFEGKASCFIDNQFYLAQFKPPNLVTIYPDNIEKIKEIIFNHEEYTFLKNIDLKESILAHELFHYIESTEKLLYTTTIKVTLWNFFGFFYRSGLTAAGEIAAMSFTRELLSLPYNPFIYSFLLLCANDMNMGKNMIKKLLAFE